MIEVTEGERIIQEIVSYAGPIPPGASLHVGLEIALNHPEYAQALLSVVSTKLRTLGHDVAEAAVRDFPVQVEL